MSRKSNRVKKLRGDRLKRLREKALLSQADLAERSGVSTRQLARYESEEAEPTAHVLAAMAKTLNCSSDYLLDLVDAPTAHVTELDAEMREFLIRFRKLPEEIRNVIRALVFRE